MSDLIQFIEHTMFKPLAAPERAAIVLAAAQTFLTGEERQQVEQSVTNTQATKALVRNVQFSEPFYYGEEVHDRQETTPQSVIVWPRHRVSNHGTPIYYLAWIMWD